MDYEVHNKNSLSYDIMLSNEVEYTNQLTNMDADNAVDKLLRDVAILKQEVTILEGDIATMKLDVKTHQKDIEMAQGQIRDINTRLGTIDLVIADIQEKLEEKASIEYVDGEVATVEVGVTTNKEVIESINTTLGEEELSTTSQNVKGAINEVLDNTVANTEAIENIDLSQYTKTYKSLTEINPTFTENTPLKDVILTMKSNTMAVYEILGAQGVYPSTYSLVTIYKVAENRNRVEVTNIYGKEKWITNYHSSNNPNCEWTKLITENNTIKTYKSLTEINPTFTVDTPIKDVILAMEDNSMAMYRNPLSSTIAYPTVGATITICKVGEDRNSVTCSSISNDKWITNYHTSGNSQCQWTKIVTQTKVEITSDMLKNGWEFQPYYTNRCYLNGNQLFINLMIRGGTKTAGTTILEGLPTHSEHTMLPTTGSNYIKYNNVGNLVIENTLSEHAWYVINAVVNLY